MIVSPRALFLSLSFLHFTSTLTYTMATRENLAATLHGAKDLRLVSCTSPSLGALRSRSPAQTKRPISAPAPGEAQVAVKATGLCGSDLHYYLHGRNGEYVLQ